MNISALRQESAKLSQIAAYELERITAELEFAQSLLELHGDQRADCQGLIERAGDLVSSAIKSGGGAALTAAVREAEGVLAPLGPVAKNYTVHCIGHAHIDMNWMWSWPETVAVVNDTFSTVLKLMDEFPTFHFSQSQASVYAIVERYNLAMLEQIRRRISEGRWEVTASHWVECDKNISSGESLCRHLLYTRRYLGRLFGLAPEDVPIDWSPDTFGHALTMPAILAHGGVKYLYLNRGGGSGPARPRAFWWRSTDGSRVLVRNDMMLGYNGSITPRVAGLLVDWVRETGVRDWMFVYGVGDHGGGPTRWDVLRAIDMNGWPIFPALRFSTARAAFEQLETQGQRLPTLDFELNFEFTGCYSSQSLIKRANRMAENRLLDAETAAAAWAGLKSPYPAADLEEGWRDTLFCQFHDILPGSGVHDTRTYAHGLFQKTTAMTGMVETLALRALAGEIDTRSSAAVAGEMEPPSSLASGQGGGVGFGAAEGLISAAEQTLGQGERPVAIFNLNAWDRREIVEATIWDNAPGGSAAKPLKERSFSVRGPDGQVVAAQVVGGGAYWGHDHATLAFPANGKGLGYALYTICEQALPTAQHSGVWQLGHRHHSVYDTYSERGCEGLENDLVRMGAGSHKQHDSIPARQAQRAGVD